MKELPRTDGSHTLNQYYRHHGRDMRMIVEAIAELQGILALPEEGHEPMERRYSAADLREKLDRWEYVMTNKGTQPAATNKAQDFLSWLEHTP